MNAKLFYHKPLVVKYDSDPIYYLSCLKLQARVSIYYPWLSMCSCLDEWIHDRNNLLRALCLRDLPKSWKKIVTMTYSIKIRPPSSEEPVIWGYFSLMDDPKCAKKERLVIRLVPVKQLEEMDRYDHNTCVICFTSRSSIL